MGTKNFEILENLTRGQVIIKDQDYKSIASMIYSKTGINLGEGKRLMVQSRLNRRLRELGIGTFEEYVEYLNSEHMDLELPHFINSITTNKTDFFRENEHFNFLKREYLASLKKKSNDLENIYYFWSAACSSGEEVYTLAMVLDEYKTENPLFNYRILGSDIDTSMLERAEKGIYSKEQIQDVGPNYLQKYFKKVAAGKNSQYKIASQLKQHLKFRQLNLIDKNQLIFLSFDIIFLRNVLIYFDRTTIQKVITFLEAHLKKDGYLFVGHSETLNGISHKLKPMGNAIYKKI
ncbi:MAG: hypothetical protein A2381_13130 [Bdellovibrionales bacterium RIFOXYB1_FULL_37_110]|nr:MAG: hypothetical protein A2181_02455 [Bdellovibrionales bacterium RIFOXYA1_FULL_38_20]OFZ51649.1 MAG: hypothetical protein A2417_12790 [Bdellovibrionales bacterium RIFOXYC1_FULL_37_79]OFZ60476.1 MAG: hypothetical protein A2381_13130 [Bdellovibrionales bacterium RIFOXYB1_FULL_37_110]OFZ65050.1 MAG: hypothetical protein A2577_09395 [Bdellovibrionales bacterium RIFOXYD1_FULL_36_51]